jgi:hypothetical protein
MRNQLHPENKPCNIAAGRNQNNDFCILLVAMLGHAGATVWPETINSGISAQEFMG